jgi:hypothetical protein
MGGDLYRAGDHSSGNFLGNVILSGSYAGQWNPRSEPRNAYYLWSKKPMPKNAVLIRPNLYDSDRFHIVIYNYQGLDSVRLDVSDLNWKAGDTYELRSVQDYFRDIMKGTYSGNGSISVKMNGHTVMKPTDWRTPDSTFPEFGVFVLSRIRTAGLSLSDKKLGRGPKPDYNHKVKDERQSTGSGLHIPALRG